MSDSAETNSGAKAVADQLNLIIKTEGIEGLVYGIAFTVTVLALYLLIHKGLRNSSSRCCLLGVLIVLFVDSTITFASNLIIVTSQIQQSGDPDYDPSQTIMKWTIIGVFSSNLNYLLGDLIVLWRTWVLFRIQRCIIFQFILAGCALVSIGGTIANITMVTLSLLQPNALGHGHNLALLTGAISLLFTNVVATLLIGYQAWFHRKFIKAHLGSLNRKSQVEHILIILTESGFIYSGIMLLPLLNSTVARVNATGSDYFAAIIPHATTIYPAIVILLTALQKTHCDSILQGSLHSQSHIQFAPGQSYGRDSRVLESIQVTPRSGDYTINRRQVINVRVSAESLQDFESTK